MTMNKREKLKNIFSWVSFIGGMLSFIYIYGLTIYGEIAIKYHINIEESYINFLGNISNFFIFLFISVAAVIFGICGIYGEENKYIRLRSFIGFTLGHLYFGLFFYFIIRYIE